MLDGEVKSIGVLRASTVDRGWEMCAIVNGAIEQLPPAHVFVVENQQAYGQGKADPNDLIRLSHVAGAAAGAAAFRAGRVLFPRPRVWKGGVPKGVHQGRVLDQIGWGYQFNGPKRPVTKVEVPEGVKLLGEIPEEHWSEVVDAIGLALWGQEQ